MTPIATDSGSSLGDSDSLTRRGPAKVANIAFAKLRVEQRRGDRRLDRRQARCIVHSQANTELLPDAESREVGQPPGKVHFDVPDSRKVAGKPRGVPTPSAGLRSTGLWEEPPLRT